MPNINEYSAIADRAEAIIGSADASQYQAAFDAMADETVTEDAAGELRITEAAILSGLGLTDGAGFIDRLTAALHPSAVRLLQGEGINVLDAQSKAALSQLLADGDIQQDEYDWVAGHYSVTRQKWPGLKPGHVQNALEYRARSAV